MPLPVVCMEPFCREDCATLARWLTDPCLLVMTAPDWKHPLTVTDVERAYFDNPAGVELLKAAENGRMVGHLGMRYLYGTTGHLFHIIADPRLHGQGYGAAMMRELARLAFCERGLRRLQLYVFDDNARAIACYLRAGFRIEGHHRDQFRCGDRWLSTYSMALLRTEWTS
jgi:RimJ/RimL family protein N-acetyltransferase